MTDRDYVIRACEMLALDLLKPKRAAPGITAYDFGRKDKGIHPCVIDAQTWAQARGQVNAYSRKLADAR